MEDVLTDDDVVKMIVYIKQKITEISLSNRKEVLKIIMASGVDDHKIHSKGNGTQVKFRDLPTDVINSIYLFVKSKVDTNLDKLNSLTEDTQELLPE